MSHRKLKLVYLLLNGWFNRIRAQPTSGATGWSLAQSNSCLEREPMLCLIRSLSPHFSDCPPTPLPCLSYSVVWNTTIWFILSSYIIKMGHKFYSKEKREKGRGEKEVIIVPLQTRLPLLHIFANCNCGAHVDPLAGLRLHKLYIQSISVNRQTQHRLQSLQ